MLQNLVQLDEARPLKSDSTVLECLHMQAVYMNAQERTAASFANLSIAVVSTLQFFGGTVHADSAGFVSTSYQSLSAKPQKAVGAHLGILKLGLDVRLHSSHNITFEILP